MSSKDVAKDALRKRSIQPAVRTEIRANTEDMKFFTSDCNGIQLHPKTVLLISIIYMGIVVVLHIFGKLR